MSEARVSREALTHIELIWHRQQIEHWIRFGRDVQEQILDRRRRILSFEPNSIVAYVRVGSGRLRHRRLAHRHPAHRPAG